jgi:hypothetical protein
MQRYIVTYETLHGKRGVNVITAKSEYLAAKNIQIQLNELGVIEILKLRKLYNPYHDKYKVITHSEKSMLLNGIYSMTDKFNLPLHIYNMISQLYGERLLNNEDYGG